MSHRVLTFALAALGLAVATLPACSTDGPSGRSRRVGASIARASPDDAGADSGTHSDRDASRPAAPTPISRENALPGTADFALRKPATNREVEGYASLTSAAAGEVVDVFVNVGEAHRVRWDLYRVGYYGGLGGRLVASGPDAHVVPQGDCPLDTTTGMVTCHWAFAFRIPVDTTWVTGQYLVKLHRDDGFESYVPFVVRESSRRAPLVVQSSVTTWQAYNTWGGVDLYENHVPQFSGARAYKVSFDRPYTGLDATDVGAGQLFLYESYMIRWLEMQGYDLSYVTNIDVGDTAGLLDGRNLFLVMGHDEYWSQSERDAVQTARDQGVSLAFFSANTAFWRIRMEEAPGGASQRVITCYKDAALDPIADRQHKTIEFRQGPAAQPENALLGTMYETFTRMDGFPIVVTNPTHWVYEGTGVAAGDTLSHLVGDEWDHVWSGPNTPANLEVLAHSPAFGVYGSSVAADTTVYYPSFFSFVFAGGTLEWSWGLGRSGYTDARIERMTENVIARAGLHAEHPTIVPAGPPPTYVGTASLVTLAAGTGEQGIADGQNAQFDAPAGVAADPSGNLYVTDSRNHRVRLITPDGTTTTFAGCGPSNVTDDHRFKNGDATHACFNVPTGIAIASDGSLYVADTDNNVIRKITPGGAVTTFAGNRTVGTRDAKNPLDATFSYPRGLAVGPDGAVYVADAYGYSLRRIGADGVTTVARSDAELSAVAVAPDGTVYVLTDSGVSTVDAGHLVPLEVSPPGDADGGAGVSPLRPSDGIIVDGDFLVVSDSANYRVVRIERFGKHRVTTLAGDGRAGLGLGTGATAHLSNPRGLALTPSGYAVADSGNNRVVRIVP